jgi:hypothetical protein
MSTVHVQILVQPASLTQPSQPASPAGQAGLARDNDGDAINTKWTQGLEKVGWRQRTTHDDDDDDDVI